MQLNLITLDTIKTQLGITGTDSDDAITAMIPVVSNDIRRILNDNFDRRYAAQIESGSNECYISDGVGFPLLSGNKPVLNMGRVVYSSSLPDDTYIIGFDSDTGKYTLSASATSDGTYLYPTISTGRWPTVAKMVWYRITTATQSDAGAKRVDSEKYGPVSVKYSQSEINARYNYPQALIDDLGPAFAEVG